jgi:hypothetical protein
MKDTIFDLNKKIIDKFDIFKKQSMNTSKDISKTIPNGISTDNIPNEISDNLISKDNSTNILNDISKDISKSITKGIPNNTLNNISSDISNVVSKDIPINIPNKISNNFSNDISNGISKAIANNTSNNISKDVLNINDSKQSEIKKIPNQSHLNDILSFDNDEKDSMINDSVNKSSISLSDMVKIEEVELLTKTERYDDDVCIIFDNNSLFQQIDKDGYILLD